jgi:stage III sporulation protein AB
MMESLAIWFKAAGSVLVLAAGGAGGWIIARGYQDRPAELRALRQALAGLRTEILYRSASLGQAWSEVARRTPSPVNRLFAHAADSLEKGEAGNAYSAWEKGIAALAADSSLSQSDLEMLRALGQGLGNSGRDGQEHVLALADQELLAAEAAADAEREKNARLWQYLGLALGASIVLLLI